MISYTFDISTVFIDVIMIKTTQNVYNPLIKSRRTAVFGKLDIVRGSQTNVLKRIHLESQIPGVTGFFV